MVAAAAVVFATVQEVLEWYASVIALIALALLLIGSLVVARTVDLAAADRALDSFDEDLDDYRESLSLDDLQQIKQLAVLRSARRHVTSARTAATWVYVTCSIVAAGLAVLLAWPNIS